MEVSTWRVLFILITAAVAINGRVFNNQLSSSNLFIESLKKLHWEPRVAASIKRANVNIEWIEQKLDHFDKNETRTWKMRYMINDEHFKEGGPMFIMVGGNWEISPALISGGHFYDMAKEHNAILFYTEHRYYGKSNATSDLSIENLKFLHTKQSLADLAHFVRYMRETKSSLANAKVIMAGGSYAASMVVWFKRLYPEYLSGGWASNALLKAQLDFKEYREVVGEAILNLGSEQCYDRIHNGFFELESMFANQRGAEVKSMMKICNNFNTFDDTDLWVLFSTTANYFASVVEDQRGTEIAQLCDYLMDFEDDAAAVAGYFLKFLDGNCADINYKSTLTSMMDTLNFVDDKNGWIRLWQYQSCNQFGWFQSSRSKNQPFGKSFPVTLWTTICADVFGEMYTNERIKELIAQTNVDFGGVNPEVEHVYLTNGGLDPWKTVGPGFQQGSVVLQNASHYNDFNSISDTDSVEMRESKERIADLIREWLK